METMSGSDVADCPMCCDTGKVAETTEKPCPMCRSKETPQGYPSNYPASGCARLLDEAIDAIGKLHGRMEPCEVDGSAAICVDAVREFVDAHARLLYERHLLGLNKA
jgi:hypothetical protein